MTAETKNIEELKAHLDPDETIDSYVFGAYDCIIMGNETLRDGILATTNKRLIFYAKKNLSYDMEVFLYSSILRIKISQDSMGHEISIFLSSNKLKLQWVNSESIDDFIAILSEKTGIKIECAVLQIIV